MRTRSFSATVSFMPNDTELPRPSAPAPWTPRAWVGLVAAVVAHSLVMWFASAFTVFDTEGSCRQPASPADLAEARFDLLVVVALAAGPWLIAAVVAQLRRRQLIRFVVSGLVVVAVPAYDLIDALTSGPADWTSSWCLF
jgi:hypothetical protein